jgi:DNA-binding beta-propeller fold protein YncE
LLVFKGPSFAKLVRHLGPGYNGAAVAVDPRTDMIYWPTDSTGTEVINGRTNKVVATIDVGSGAYSTEDGVVVNPVTDTIYVSAGEVSVIDGQTRTITGQITVPNGYTAVGVAADSVNDRLYIAVWNTGFDSDGIVDAVNGATNDVIATARVGEYPTGIVVNPRTRNIYSWDSEGLVVLHDECRD